MTKIMSFQEFMKSPLQFVHTSYTLQEDTISTYTDITGCILLSIQVAKITHLNILKARSHIWKSIY